MDISRPSILKNGRDPSFVYRPHAYQLPYQGQDHLNDDGGAISGDSADMKDMEMVPHEEATRKVGANDVVLTDFRTEPLPQIKAAPGQDSDVDSGIVGCGQRVGSTSSTDTDSSSHESRIKLNYCAPALNKDQIQRINGVHFRAVKRNDCLPRPGSPVRGDHSVLKECNRRPPTPLTVFGDSTHCVRFDEHLHLSEQSIRRSCRKLFATLYAQRFSYSPATSQTTESIPGNGPVPGSYRDRSQTLPSADQRPNYSMVHERPRLSSRIKGPIELTKNKENSSVGSRKVVSWNLSPRILDQLPLQNERRPKKVSVSPYFMQKTLQLSENKPIQSINCQPSLKASTDSGLGGCRGTCTCHCSPRSSGGYSSQSSTSSNSSTSTGHCCSCCSNDGSAVEPPLVGRFKTLVGSNSILIKSNSCSTLPRMLMQTFPRGPPSKEGISKAETPQPVHAPSMQKTSSCTDLLNRACNVPVKDIVPVYNDSMMHVYAQVASVVPDDACTKSRNIAYYQQTNERVYDTVKSPPVPLPTYPLPKNRNSTVSFCAYKNSKRSAISIYGKEDLFLGSRNSNDTKDYAESTRGSTSSEIYAPFESRLVPYQSKIRQENPYNYAVATIRPTVLSSSSTDSRIKSALKHPKTNHIGAQSADHQMSLSGSISTIPSEAEYAIVDKSKKNRFTSLPALDQYGGGNCITDEDKDQPPIPPKKNLHNSEANLYRSRSSSPKKTFLEKMNGLTKSAKSVFQRAFSTERIYRPEKEERLEATGQSLNRSKSFMKGLRASISKKRKKSKPPMAEVVPQASCNPLWDEQSSGKNASIHVRGQLLQLNLDGSQVVELSKPHNRPYGFFVARGRVRNSKGVFVSRMRDQETQKQLAGLLDIGDEILEIEGINVKNANIMEVNDLMANKNTLLLTVLPYICRKDI